MTTKSQRLKLILLQMILSRVKKQLATDREMKAIKFLKTSVYGPDVKPDN